MKPIKFKEQNCVYAENQQGYLPLPAHKTTAGLVISCWKLTPGERLRMLFSGKLWLGTLTFGQRLQPQMPQIRSPFGPMEGQMTAEQLAEARRRLNLAIDIPDAVIAKAATGTFFHKRIALDFAMRRLKSGLLGSFGKGAK